ncbi:MAG: hypothetical protein GW938_15490 [Leptospira sp.]|nr:hypothetical protein [Leptospira sp.]
MKTLGSVAEVGKSSLTTGLKSGLAILVSGLDAIVAPAKILETVFIKDR